MSSPPVVSRGSRIRDRLRYYEELCLLTCVSIAHCVRYSIPRAVRRGFVSPSGPADTTTGQGLAVRCHLKTASSHGHVRPLLFPGNPHRDSPGSKPPSRPTRQAIRRIVLVRGTAQATDSRHCYFGGQLPDTSRRCLRFAVALAERPRKTRFRPAGQHYRVGVGTHWVPSNGFWLLHVAIPPFQS
jgi:hypothetical protein